MVTPDAVAPSFESLYAELRRLARRELHKGGVADHMSDTTLLHEAYLQMSGRDGLVFADRGHFLAYAARAMRGIAIERLAAIDPRLAELVHLKFFAGLTFGEHRAQGGAGKHQGQGNQGVGHGRTPVRGGAAVCGACWGNRGWPKKHDIASPCRVRSRVADSSHSGVSHATEGSGDECIGHDSGGRRVRMRAFSKLCRRVRPGAEVRQRQGQLQ